jgi:23S rRNA (pseudouridine1915-N3)-methyltransferase
MEVFLFDEHGREFRSIEYAGWLQKKMSSGRDLTLVIGGPYGFSQEVYARADGKLSLSKMTFSHQMVRLFAVEQLYRAMTILRHEPYHHE